jgi:cytochrome c
MTVNGRILVLGLWVAGFLSGGVASGGVARAVGVEPRGLTIMAAAQDDGLWEGIGRDATAEEIRAWDIAVMPDGTGLPPGRGTVPQGAVVYAQRCAVCHGDGGQGVPGLTVEVVIDREPWFELGNPNQLRQRTIGNYWPYATTLFDYTRRTMPFEAPGALSDDDVYSVVAWLLNQNGIIPDDAVMDARTLPAVRMPGRDLFVPDPRPDQR